MKYLIFLMLITINVKAQTVKSIIQKDTHKSGIVINGATYSGQNVTITDGDVFIDGKKVNSKDAKVINITVHGDVGKIDTQSADVTVNGTVKGDVETMSGDVTAGKIEGDAETMSGDITH